MKICPQCSKRFEPIWAKCPDDGAELNSEKPDPLLGQIFAEHYQILSILGRGGMSVVYKAKHKLMDRIVAIKVLHGDADKVAIDRFKHEAQTASALNHNNIITVYEFGIFQGQAFLVMDCLEGKNLNEILQEDIRIPVERAINIFRQTCVGLDHAHKKGVVHRDLKPSNLILVQGDGGEVVKIVDFGIAKLMPETGKDQTRLTQTGEVFGSPLYMSPEQCLARPIDVRSDIYSFGCLMYECLTGVVPLEGDTAYETMTMHVSKPPPPFAKAAPDMQINSSIEAMVFRCLEKKPEDRYQSAAEIMADLPTIKAESGSMKIRTVQHPTKQRREIKYLRFGFWTLFTFCAALFAYMSCDHGSDLDRGTVLEKTIWNAQTTLAQTLTDNKMFEPARMVLDSAENTARKKFSNKARLLTVLNMKKRLFEKARLFEEMDAVNKNIATVTNQILIVSYDSLSKDLDRVAAAVNGPEASVDKITASIKVGAVDHLVKALLGAHMNQHAEDLAARAKEVYTSLLGPGDVVIGDLDMLMADCHARQQRLPAVRPLLVEALNIYKNTTAANSKRIITATLRLGELDCTINRYDMAKSELMEAADSAAKHFKSDTNLNYECLNALACYYSEMNRTKEAAETFAKATALNPKDQTEE